MEWNGEWNGMEWNGMGGIRPRAKHTRQARHQGQGHKGNKIAGAAMSPASPPASSRRNGATTDKFFRLPPCTTTLPRTPSRTPVHGLRRRLRHPDGVMRRRPVMPRARRHLDDALSATASSMGDAKELVSLIQRGLDPDTVDAQNNTLLILAAREGPTTAAVGASGEDRARLDYRNPAGDSALMLAVLRPRDAARALIKAGAVVATMAGAPLHYAAFEGPRQADRDLLAAGAGVNAPAPNKATTADAGRATATSTWCAACWRCPQTDLNALNDAGFRRTPGRCGNNNTDIAELVQAERKLHRHPSAGDEDHDQ